MPKMLLIDTACSYATIYHSLEDDLIVEQESHRLTCTHDHFLFHTLHTLAMTSPSIHQEWDIIGVCIGPGRFNSVRVACSVIATFMSVLHKPAYLCTAFELLREADQHEGIEGYAIFAKSGFAYYQSSDFSCAMEMKPIAELSFRMHVLEIEGSFIQHSRKLDLKGLHNLIQQGRALKIDRAIDLEPAYCAML